MTADELALRAQHIIVGVEGVAGLYPARSAVLAGIASAIGADETLVAVDVDGPRLQVRARIAALTDSSAPRLVRDVAAALRAGLSADPGSADNPVDLAVDITVCGFTDVPFD